MKQRLLSLALLALAGSAGLASADAQAPTRLRGTISAFDGKVLLIRPSAGREVEVQVAEKAEIVLQQPIALADIKPGDFLAVTSIKRPDGTLTAYEVRRFPKPVNPGHRAFEGRDDQTMTNATVAASVQAASGRELTLAYEGGRQKIMVPEGTSVSMLMPGQRAQLVPGAAVNLTAAPGADGKLVAQRIQVSARKP